jgi:adenosylcobinamide-GDP ribazoletransferase
VLPAALLCLPLAILPLPVPALLGSAALAVLIPAAVLLLGRRLFGGVNGDLVGASHELCRAAVLCAAALLG